MAKKKVTPDIPVETEAVVWSRTYDKAVYFKNGKISIIK